MTGEVVGNAVMGCGWVWRDFPRCGSARSLVAGVGGRTRVDVWSGVTARSLRSHWRLASILRAAYILPEATSNMWIMANKR